MASNGLQSGQGDAPAFPEGDAPALGADYEEVARYARKRGNSLVGTTADRTAYSTYAREGETFWDTTLHFGYLRLGGTWVPDGAKMPSIDLVSATSHAVNGLFGIGIWAAPGSGGSENAGGSSWFTYAAPSGNGAVQVKNAGRYRIVTRFNVGFASGQALAAAITLNGNTSSPIAQDTVQTHASYGTPAKLEVAEIVLAANDSIAPVVIATTTALTIGGSGRAFGEFSIRYLGPV